MVLALTVVGNVFYVLRYREAHRDSARVEESYSQQLPTASIRLQALEGVIRDFAARAGGEPEIADILRQHSLISTNPPEAKP